MLSGRATYCDFVHSLTREVGSWAKDGVGIMSNCLGLLYRNSRGGVGNVDHCIDSSSQMIAELELVLEDMEYK